MIDQLFDWFLSATIRGSILCGAVLLIQAVFRDRLSAFWRHALWLPVVFVLASPALPRSPLSLERHWVNDGGSSLPPVFAFASGSEVGESNSDRVSGEGTMISTPEWEPAEFLPWLWLIGAGAFVLVGLLAYAGVLRNAKSRSVPVEPVLMRELAAAGELIQLRRLPKLLVSEAVESPAITGILRPVLLLPANFLESFGSEERRLILLHELVHFRRGDLAVNGLLFLLQALHWCNPIVWLALARIRLDRELACDSAVMASCNGASRQSYGRALIKLSDASRPMGLGLGFVGMFGRGRELKSRVTAIAGHRRRSAWWSAPALVAMAILLVAGGTKATSEDKNLEPSENNGAGEPIEIQARIIELESASDQVTVVADESTFDRKSQVITFVQDGDDVKSFFPEGNVKVLSSPTVVTLPGQKAIISTTESAVTEEGEGESSVGLNLEVVPAVKGDEIELNIKIVNKKRIDVETGKEVLQDLPLDQSKLVESIIVSSVVLEPGQTALLGGLYEEGEQSFVAVTPKLSNSFDDIVIPHLKLVDAELREVMGMLQKLRSEQLDHSKMKKGDSHGIIVDGNGKGAPRLTLELKDKRLSEVLKYVAALSGMTYRTEGNLIIFEGFEDESSEP